LQNKEQRYIAYRKTALLLGYWQRTQLPDCTVAAIRQACHSRPSHAMHAPL
jgi:hypothetical protein